MQIMDLNESSYASTNRLSVYYSRALPCISFLQQKPGIWQSTPPSPSSSSYCHQGGRSTPSLPIRTMSRSVLYSSKFLTFPLSNSSSIVPEITRYAVLSCPLNYTPQPNLSQIPYISSSLCMGYMAIPTSISNA